MTRQASTARATAQRSELMSRIRGKNTEPEKLLRSMLWRRGLRFRINDRTPAGRADIVFRAARVAVFIDGCFWHGCPEHYVRPRSREQFWAAKLRENVERDRRQSHLLAASGWTVIRAWEHEVFEALDSLADRVVDATHGKRDQRPRPMVISVTPLDLDGSRERRHHVDLWDDGWNEDVEQDRHTRKWPRNATPTKSRKRPGTR